MMYDFICSVPAPVKPCKKLYCSDESYAVPRSTLYRWKSNKSRKSLTFGEVRGTVLTSKFLELETMFISHKRKCFVPEEDLMSIPSKYSPDISIK